MIKKKAPYYSTITLSSPVKHGGGNIIVWACFAVSRPGNLTIIDGTKLSERLSESCSENTTVSVD